MQFVLVCRVGTDENALERRRAAREAHLVNPAFEKVFKK